MYAWFIRWRPGCFVNNSALPSPVHAAPVLTTRDHPSFPTYPIVPSTAHRSLVSRIGLEKHIGFRFNRRKNNHVLDLATQKAKALLRHRRRNRALPAARPRRVAPAIPVRPRRSRLLGLARPARRA